MENDTGIRSVSTTNRITSQIVRQWFYKWGLTFFISAWMFVLGVFIGRGTIKPQFDIQNIEKELVYLKETMIKDEMKKYKLDQDKDFKSVELGFHEQLKKGKVDTDFHPTPTSVNPRSAMNNNSESEGKAVVQKTSTTVKSNGVQKTSTTVKSESEIKPDKKTEKPQPAEVTRKNEPQPIQNNTDNKGLSIQIASFKEAAIADKKVEELKKKGYPAYRVSGEISGQGTWHRIRIGNYKNKEDAKTMIEKLKSEKYNPMIINVGN